MRKILLVILSFISIATAFGKDLPPRPSPPRLVNDYTNTLNAQEVASLEQRLVAYSDSTSTQIAIVIEASLDGEDMFDYSHRLAQAWKIGMEGKKNGLLIYVALKEKKVWIQTGYGLEGSITDALSKRIIDEHIKPRFKQNQYYIGLLEATDIIMRAASGEFINENPHHRQKERSSPYSIIAIIVIIVVISIFNKRGGGGRRMGGFYPFFGTFGSGGFSGGSFGGGSGGGGGGFSGFGGGSFGGGGAGGSW